VSQNDDERFFEDPHPDDLPWDDIGRINQDGYVDTRPINTDPRIFEDQFEIRSRELVRTPPATSAVTVIPAKSGPWTANNQLGIEQTFAPSANNRQTILKLNEWGFPQNWSILLGLDFDPAFFAGPSNGFSIIAHIEAGAGGTIQSVDVDWVQGTCLCLPMNALNVIAEYDNISDIPPDLRLRVTITPGKTTDAKPIRTFYMSIPGGSAERQIEIPKFAKRVWLSDRVQAGDSVYSASADIRMFSTPAGGQGVRVVGTTLLALGGWLEVPNGARFLSIFNGGAAPPAPNMDVVLVFELYL
jgi:hypothetical protein